MSPDILYQGHGMTYEWNIFFFKKILMLSLNNVMTWKTTIFFLKKNIPGLRRIVCG